MASSSVLQQLAKKSPQYKAAILLLALVVLGFLYYQFRYSGLTDDKTQLDGRKNSLNAQQRTLDRQLIEQEELLAKKKELERSIRDNEKALPTKAELPAFFDHLQRKAGDTGVSIHKWERVDELPVDIYVRVPVTIEVIGTFYEIMHYFSALGPQQRDKLQDAAEDQDGDGERIDERIVSIENLELDKARLQDGEIVLDAKFVASTFRQKDKPKKAKPKKAKPKKAKPKKKGTKPETKGTKPGTSKPKAGAKPGTSKPGTSKPGTSKPASGKAPGKTTSKGSTSSLSISAAGRRHASLDGEHPSMRVRSDLSAAAAAAERSSV